MKREDWYASEKQGASAVADRALVASPSNPQAVSTKGFDPSRIFARASQILAEKCPNGTTDTALLEGAVRDAIGELMLGGFRVGQEVRHSSRGRGIVRKIRDGALHVEFDDCPGRISGIFDAGWFRNCKTATLTAYEAKGDVVLDEG